MNDHPLSRPIVYFGTPGHGSPERLCACPDCGCTTHVHDRVCADCRAGCHARDFHLDPRRLDCPAGAGELVEAFRG